MCCVHCVGSYNNYNGLLLLCLLALAGSLTCYVVGFGSSGVLYHRVSVADSANR